MVAYVVAVLDKHDKVGYAEYSRRGRAALAEENGEILISDDTIELLEGNPLGHRMVVLKFEDEASAKRWWNSADYQAAIPLRHGAATTHCIFLAKGFEKPA